VAIPTRYNGVKFRSRLEARWAAFFEQCGWPWEYEPFDLEGWIPDFLIKGASPCLVEVKPITWRHTSDERWKQSLSMAAKAHAFETDDRIETEIMVRLKQAECPDGDWASLHERAGSLRLTT
jgi:hypothetical protein